MTVIICVTCAMHCHNACLINGMRKDSEVVVEHAPDKDETFSHS